jgi:hypothetical protein
MFVANASNTVTNSLTFFNPVIQEEYIPDRSSQSLHAANFRPTNVQLDHGGGSFERQAHFSTSKEKPQI